MLRCTDFKKMSFLTAKYFVYPHDKPKLFESPLLVQVQMPMPMQRAPLMQEVQKQAEQPQVRQVSQEEEWRWQ